MQRTIILSFFLTNVCIYISSCGGSKAITVWNKLDIDNSSTSNLYKTISSFSDIVGSKPSNIQYYTTTQDKDTAYNITFSGNRSPNDSCSIFLNAKYRITSFKSSLHQCNTIENQDRTKDIPNTLIDKCKEFNKVLDSVYDFESGYVNNGCIYLRYLSITHKELDSLMKVPNLFLLDPYVNFQYYQNDLIWIHYGG